MPRNRSPIDISIGAGGWVRFEHEGLGALMHFADREGRLVVVELYFDSTDDPNGLSVSALRRFPTGHCEAIANAEPFLTRIRRSVSEYSLDMRTLARYYDLSVGPGAIPKPEWGPRARQPDWVQLSFLAQDPATGYTRPRLVPHRKYERVEPANEVERVSSRVTKPARKPFGDEFYKTVAAAYLALVEAGVSNPNKRIADESDEKVEVVRRWVAEARVRGLLPRARSGATA